MSSPAVMLAAATAQLQAAGMPSPAAEARTLLGHASGLDSHQLLLASDLPDEVVVRFAALVDARAQGTPIQHLTGEAWFRTVRVEVGPGVFVPRPETEVMTGWAIEQLAGLDAPVVVELCAGSGAISKAIATELPIARVHAVELDDDACDYARRNLAGTGVDLVQDDMATAFAELDGLVDLVIANPPYIPLEAWESVTAEVRDHDPALALWSGEDGLDATRVVARVAARLLREGGLVCSEHAEVQEHSAPEVFVQQGGFAQVRDRHDLAGRPRFVTAVRGGALFR